MSRTTTRLAVACLLLAPSVAMAADLPVAGSCQHRHMAAGSFVSMDLIDWRGDTGTIQTLGTSYPARVAGLRPHDGMFRLSLFYTDQHTGPTELVIFAMRLGGETSYHMGQVSYHDMPDGVRVATTIAPFEEMTCDLTY
ncbi:hypothetical protein [Maritimibacter sp. UBA3975]|uniref:hypothetical protein n=1 Tax=Maritimibacter sp. UBA3975 TaxID=1946833 RepID=UPI000C0B54A5|nr:hypothetical protein [Maritimibacter sp. UBA3975]MAM60995.1 hypothetical protein [Maritimibacter sp.]|tara:strand:+ start:45505 stop:45921 length:417 start_codon:yes stop_codon:yes gene_type:complete